MKYREHDARFKQAKDEDWKQTLACNSEYFTLALHCGAKKRGRGIQQTRYKCAICNLNYNTSIAAMVAHRDSHLNRKFIRVGKIKQGVRFKNEWRPIEHHYNRKTDSYAFAGSARLHCVIPPNEIFSEGMLQCQKCNFCVPFSTNLKVMSAHMQSAAATKFTRHKCKA